jgi:hypothetical protein
MSCLTHATFQLYLSWPRRKTASHVRLSSRQGKLNPESIMKPKFHHLFIALALLAFLTLNHQLSTAFAQGTAFTYQGQLQNNGSPASGIYNLTFSLFNANSSGVAITEPVTNNAVLVTNGLFTVLIDFGSDVSIGGTNWLEMGVETNGTSTFTTLMPRQRLSPAPYAIFAENANGLSGTVSASQLTSIGNTNGSASGNFFIGSSGNSTTSGLFSTANGVGALADNTSGSYNTANGVGALADNTSGGDNMAIGGDALHDNLIGSFNTANGVGALEHNTSGEGNTANGVEALAENSSGSSNIAIGFDAGVNITTGSSNIDIGNLGFSTDTNIIRIGSGQTQTFIAGVIANSDTLTLQAGSDMDLTASEDVNVTANTDMDLKSQATMTVESSVQTVIKGGTLLSLSSALLELNAPTTVVQNMLNVGGETILESELLVDGNVGIGTTSPQQALSVAGGMNIDQASLNSGTVANALTFGSSSGEGIGSQRTGSGNLFDLVFYTASNARMTILNNGNVGIGEANPAGALHITGPASTPPSALPGADNGLVLGTTGTSGYKWIQSFGGPLILNPTSNEVGIGTTSPDELLSVNGSADKPGGGSWNTFSDGRLKDVGTKFTHGLEALDEIQPVHYHYKSDNPLKLPSQPEYVGVVAQQVQSAIPEAVQRNKDGYLVVNNDPIIWTMFNAIKELNQKFESATKAKDMEIQTLKQQNDLLAERLNELEAAKQLAANK